MRIVHLPYCYTCHNPCTNKWCSIVFLWVWPIYFSDSSKYISLVFPSVFLWFCQMYFSDFSKCISLIPIIVWKGWDWGLSTCSTLTPVTLLASTDDFQLYFFGFQHCISLILSSVFLWSPLLFRRDEKTLSTCSTVTPVTLPAPLTVTIGQKLLLQFSADFSSLRFCLQLFFCQMKSVTGVTPVTLWHKILWNEENLQIFLTR